MKLTVNPKKQVTLSGETFTEGQTFECKKADGLFHIKAGSAHKFEPEIDEDDAD